MKKWLFIVFIGVISLIFKSDVIHASCENANNPIQTSQSAYGSINNADFLGAQKDQHATYFTLASNSVSFARNDNSARSINHHRTISEKNNHWSNSFFAGHDKKSETDKKERRFLEETIHCVPVRAADFYVFRLKHIII